MSEPTSPLFPRYQLSELAAPGSDTFVDGPFGSNLKSHEYVDAGVRLIQLQNIGEGEWRDGNKKFITLGKYKTLERHGAIPGDIAIAKMADPVARACLVPPVSEQFVVVADCIRLRLDESRFDPGFVVRSINSPYTRREAEKKAIGSTRVRINLSVLKTVGCLAPGLPEQQAITRILDTLDTAIHQTEAIIAKLKCIKQGLLHDLLTRGIDSNGELRPPQADAPQLYKPSPLGWIPKEWELSTVGTEFEIQLGKMLDSQKNVGVLKPYIGNKAVQWDRIDLCEVQQVRLSESDLLRFRLQHGDLLVCEGGEVGRAAIWEGELGECFYQKALHRLRPLRGYRPRLMLELLRYLMSKDTLSEYISKTSIAHLTQEKLAVVPLPVPFHEEQDRIVAEFVAAKHREESEHAQQRKFRLLKSGFMDDLLTGRVRVTPLLEASK